MRMPVPYVWRDATRVVWVESGGPDAPAVLWQSDAVAGKKTKLLDAPAVKTRDGKEKNLSLRGAAWTPKGDAFAVSFDSDLWLVTPGGDGGPARRLTNDAEDETLPAWSPDGARLAYVKKHDLFVLEAATGKETRLTKTGTDTVLNGVLDWVYGEELAGRRGKGSFFWSPDSSAIAYLSLDQTRVPTYPIVDYMPTNGRLETQRYPKAGDPNAIPSVHVVDLAGNETAAFAPSPDDVYVAPEMTWTQDGKNVCFLLLDRPQTHLGVWLLPRAGGAPKKLLEESDPAWINAISPPHFLKDGSFVFLSERSGFFHLYRHAADGSVKNAITKGAWMVDGPWAVDERLGTVWFRATTGDPRERQIFVTKLDGSSMVRVSLEPGVHAPLFAPGAAYFVDSHSSAAVLPRTVVRSASGAVAAALDDKPHPLGEFDLGSVELGSFTGSDGTLFYTRLAKPSNFDPAKKYPVVVYVYGGPHTQLVQNAAAPVLDAYLASKGFLVWTMDGRGSGGRGHAFEAPVLKNMGVQELKDQLEGVAELKKRPYVDGARIGITGLVVRRVHDALRRDARGWDVQVRGRGRARRRLDALRLDLHRALHEDAEGEPGGVQGVVAAPRGEGPRDEARDLPRHVGRQRPHAEHDEVCRRAHEGAEGLRFRAAPAPDARAARRSAPLPEPAARGVVRAEPLTPCRPSPKTRSRR